MTGLAVVLVLAAAGIHALWNLLAKRGGGSIVFVWFYAGTASLLWAPITLPTFLGIYRSLTGIDWVFLVGSGVIHMVYFLLLQAAYGKGDLSLVYPLARGTGPALASIAAIVFFGERPTLPALAGMLLVATSILLFSSPANGSGSPTSEPVFLGIATGILIAFYTLWDKHAVAARGIPPLVMEWFTSIVRLVLLLPVALNHWKEVVHNWYNRRTYAIWIGVLSPLAYLLVLTAMTFTPVSYVAPAREISVLFAAFLGGHFLREGDRGRRMAAASVMVAGIICIVLG